MDMKYLAVIALWIAADKILQRKCPKAWERIQFPINLILSTLSLGCVVFMAAAAYQVAAGDLKTGDKAVFFLLAIGYISTFTFANYSVWREWGRKRRTQN